jgi:hypothetical protein
MSLPNTVGLLPFDMQVREIPLSSTLSIAPGANESNWGVARGHVRMVFGSVSLSPQAIIRAYYQAKTWREVRDMTVPFLQPDAAPDPALIGPLATAQIADGFQRYTIPAPLTTEAWSEYPWIQYVDEIKVTQTLPQTTEFFTHQPKIGLATAYASALNSSEVNVLSTADIISLSTADLAGLTPVVIDGNDRASDWINPSYLKSGTGSLSTDTLSGLTTLAICAFSSSEIAAFTSDRVAELSALEVPKISFEFGNETEALPPAMEFNAALFLNAPVDSSDIADPLVIARNSIREAARRWWLRMRPRDGRMVSTRIEQGCFAGVMGYVPAAMFRVWDAYSGSQRMAMDGRDNIILSADVSNLISWDIGVSVTLPTVPFIDLLPAASGYWDTVFIFTQPVIHCPIGFTAIQCKEVLPESLPLVKLDFGIDETFDIYAYFAPVLNKTTWLYEAPDGALVSRIGDTDMSAAQAALDAWITDLNAVFAPENITATGTLTVKDYSGTTMTSCSLYSYAELGSLNCSWQIASLNT